MEFTYEEFVTLIETVKNNGYVVCDYASSQNVDRAVVLRHDVDMSVKAAHKIAEIERDLGVKSTYFFLLNSEFYNVFSNAAEKAIGEIAAMGHDIGLHFDPAKYDVKTENDFVAAVNRECHIMRSIFGENTARVVSTHRPSKFILDNDLHIEGLINTYSQTFFKEYAYFSDSRMRWKADIIAELNSRKHNKIQLLTHPIWYGEKTGTIAERLKDFCACKREEVYKNLNDNITDFDSIIAKENQI